MFRTYKYALKPNRTQDKTLREWLRITCELYNDALQERRDAWKKQGVSVTRIDQQKQLTEIRKFDTSLAGVPVVLLRYPLRKVELSFQAFFRRCKSGEKLGYPRF